MEPISISNSSSEEPKTPESTLNSGEIDTSAPFDSVKEAVDRFGGCAVWKTQLKQLVCPDSHHCSEDIDIVEMEEEAAQLKKALMLKERETLDVLKDLEKTKKIVDDLKLRLQQATSEVVRVPTVDIEGVDMCATDEAEDSGIGTLAAPHERADNCPGQTLIELKQAKVNLNRRTTDLTGIQSAIKLLNSEIKEERFRLEQAQQKLTSNTALILLLEDGINQTTEKLQFVKDIQQRRREDPSSVLQEIKQKNLLIDQSKRLAESARVEVAKLTFEIEQTKASTKTAEIRFLAAQKMEVAANAAKDAALAEIKALMSSCNSIDAKGIAGVTLTLEEYATLTNAVQEADQKSKMKIEAAMRKVDEANKSESEILVKVEEATQKVKVFTNALENAVVRVEAANQGKLAVEDALRKWRSEHGQKRRNVHNVTKFKTTAHHQKKDCHMIDLDDSSSITDLPSSGFRPTLSIGQILSMKLTSPECMEYDVGVSEKENEKPKFSLGQMLNKKQVVLSPRMHSTEDASAGKHFTAKRKKIGIVGFSLLLAKQTRRTRRRGESLNSR